ncbi:hypothetical protein [Planococcus halotolerans]|uniref:Uncharacterized protein n=1 Tax=Planococcus halotolerans TaxID=2233542 RepID=A0A365KSE1_9BACL|nr:hypothetical protein [Planococcus halotolerans]QHJ69345.1 hypothetical protein DNR44_001285 [Planococcus halotolerans]RAZ75673.1 hypothetical protein DP120_12785 [Planococcus halotolerans]
MTKQSAILGLFFVYAQLWLEYAQLCMKYAQLRSEYAQLAKTAEKTAQALSAWAVFRFWFY